MLRSNIILSVDDLVTTYCPVSYPSKLMLMLPGFVSSIVYCPSLPETTLLFDLSSAMVAPTNASPFSLVIFPLTTMFSRLVILEITTTNSEGLLKVKSVSTKTFLSNAESSTLTTAIETTLPLGMMSSLKTNRYGDVFSTS